MPERVIVYVDGFNLYFGMLDGGYRKYLWLDVKGLASALAEPTRALLHTKYFTSRIQGPVDKRQRQNAIIDANRWSDGITYYFGEYQRSTITCRACGATYERHSEKRTDVNIAAELLVDAHEDRFDMAILISGDNDLLPVVKALRSAFPKKRIRVAFPPKRHTNAMKQAANSHVYIGEPHLRDNQLPDEVTLPSGFVIRRPTSWR